MIPQKTPGWPCFRSSYFICPNGARKIYHCMGSRRMGAAWYYVYFLIQSAGKAESQGKNQGTLCSAKFQSLWCLARFTKLNCTFVWSVATSQRFAERLSWIPFGCLAPPDVPTKHMHSFHAPLKCPVSPHSPVVVPYLSGHPKGNTEGGWVARLVSLELFWGTFLAPTPASPAGTQQKWVGARHTCPSVLFQSALRQLWQF